MGTLKNNYFSIGFNDLRYLLAYDCNDTLSYNRVAAEAQQVLEKLLKGMVEMCDIKGDSFLPGSAGRSISVIIVKKRSCRTVSVPHLAYFILRAAAIVIFL